MICKFFAATVISVFLALLAVPQEAGAGREGNLYHLLSDRALVKVFIGDIEDTSSVKKTNTVALREELKRALEGRKSINFEVVSAREEADLQIDCRVMDFVWSDSDPLDMIGGLGMIAMDAAVVEDYVRQEADFKVTDAKTEKILWSDRVTATVTKADMNEQAGIELINKDMAKVFVRDCFSKGRAGAKRS